MEFQNCKIPEGYINAKTLTVVDDPGSDYERSIVYRILVYKDDWWAHSGYDTFEEYEINCPHGLISMTIERFDSESEMWDDHDFEYSYLGFTDDGTPDNEWIFKNDVYGSAVGEFMASRGLI